MKIEYGWEVVESLKVAASKQMQECISLANIIKKTMAEVISRQHGKYYGFGNHGRELYVFEQAKNIDNIVT